MAKADISVSFSNGETLNGMACYAPGEEVRGTIQVIAEADVRCNKMIARLQWHTEGRGDRDTGKITETELFQGTLRSGFPTSYDFQFTLPQEPWSYAGHYINIVWEIFVELDVPWAVNPRHSQPFLMAPARRR